MKVGVDLISGRISPGEFSHKAAWAYLLANQLKHGGYEDVKVLHKDEPWDDYDAIFIYHGMEFQGSLNLFGGASAETANKFARLLEYDGELVSLDIPMPDYGKLGKTRLKSCDDVWAATDWDAISEKCKTIPYIRHPNPSDHLTFGDSHSFSAYQPNSMTVRLDGKTMFGALRQGLKDVIEENEVLIKDLNKLTLYLGNIDVRHHLCRQDDPKTSVDKMMAEYEKQILELDIDHIELVELLPIENESRKLPKTGYYKGTPFYGSWAERNEVKDHMNSWLESLCNKHNWDYYTWPETFVNDKGELDFEYMEKPRSVHLGRKYYRWDLVNDRDNHSDNESEASDSLLIF